MYSWTLHHLALPVYDALLNRRSVTAIRELRAAEHASRDEILDKQRLRVRAMLDYAYATTPFYKNAFDAAGVHPSDFRELGDLVKFPVLSREKLRTNTENLKASDFNKYRMMKWSTGGSTGSPTPLYHNPHKFDYTRAANLRSFEWAGYKLGDPFVRMSASDLEAEAHTRIIKKLSARITRKTFVAATAVTSDDFEVLVSCLRGKAQHLLVGYTSVLAMVARGIIARNITDIIIPAIIPQGENVSAEQRHDIETAFHGRLFDNYGSREIMIASQCGSTELPDNKGGHYHCADEVVYVEIIREGRPALPGEVGKVILTDLHNFGFPLIRYEIGDLATTPPQTTECPCGRPLTLLASIEGRTGDILQTADGRYISLAAISHFMKDVKGLREFQFHQLSQNQIILRVVPEGDNAPEAKALIAHCHRFLGSDMSIDVEICDKVPRAATGKFRFVVSDIPADF